MPPQFKTEAQGKVYARVAEILQEQFGKQARANEEAPSFAIRAGSASGWASSGDRPLVRPGST